MQTIRKLTLAVLAVAALPTASAGAAPVVDPTTFPMADVGSNSQLVAGSDGNVYVARETKGLGEVVGTPVLHTTIFDAGNFTAGVLGTPSGGIAATPGFVWLSQTPTGVQPLVKIPLKPDGSGADTLAATGVANADLTTATTALTTGPDGNLWAAIANTILKIDPATGATLTKITVAGLSPFAIAAGAGNTLWVSDTNGKLLNLPATAAAATDITSYNVGNDGQPRMIAVAPSGQIAWTNPLSTPHLIGLLTPGGAPAPISYAPQDPLGATFGGDGAFWVAEFARNRITRVTTDGQATFLDTLPVVTNQGPRQILAVGTTLWVTVQNNNDPTLSRIARVTGVEPVVTPPVSTPTAPIVPVKDTTPPKLTSLKLNHTKVTTAATSVKVTFRLSELARVRVLVEKRKGGRRKGSKCVAPTKALRKARLCTRYVRITSKSPPLMPGRNSISITTRRWGPGSYRFTVTATDSAGNVAKGIARNLTVVRKKTKK